ncbi:MAG: tetratricopeptide repeat protein [Deltaproteobacteria bacterium]|nr:tetratricopeptide repeat protein [Deltaproteobacteria bacterium]
MLKGGIEQYQEENYEEAAEILEEARKLYPKSSPAAFFLGMTYKQMMDYQKALINFRDAVTLTPRIKQALIELIDVAVHLQKLEEAKKWIAVAEEYKIFAPRMAFLKGQLLMKKGKNMEAVEAFERARSLDESLSQTVDIQIALCYMKEKNLKKAKERFQSAVLQDPESDMATFARQYQDMVEKRLELERPVRVTFAISEQFNTNLLSNPNDSQFTSGNADQQVYSTAPSLRVNYSPTLKGPWLFTAQYALSGNFHDEYSTSQDTVSNSASIVPGYNFGTFSLNLPTTYSYSMLRAPSYKEYSDSLSTGLMLRKAFGQAHMVELFGGYNRKEYFQPPTREEEDKDSTGYNAYISWIWMIKGIFFNLKYEYISENTDGEWWDNEGHKFSANAVLPLIDKVKLQLSGQSYHQDYRNNHILLGNKDKREDETYTASLGLTWEFMKNTSLVLQYTKTRVNSNIGYYEYEQGLYSSGLEYRY